MTDAANLKDCFNVDAPCLSEDGASCIMPHHVSSLTHVITTVYYGCSFEDVEIVVEFTIKADGFYTTEDEFATVSLYSEAYAIRPGEQVTLGAEIGGVLVPDTHVDITCQIWVNGDAVDGASNIHANMEIEE
ncbi:hypothetical protein [Shinella sp.]|uniref:hypothetical protein n=1 Tax=Shinella sp. TaxID=1870904 RepID=UPI0039E61E3D